MIRINTSPKRITLLFAGTTVFLTVIHILGQLILSAHGRKMDELWLIELFNVDRERSIPTLYSFTALQFCALLLALIAYAKHQLSQPYTFYWALLSFVFAYLALDEGLSFHEQLITPSVSWVVPYLALLGAFVLSLIRFLNHLPRQTRRLFVLSGLIFVGGAAGLEIPGGQYLHASGGNTPYLIMVTIEEFLEMSGIVTFIYALLAYLNKHLPRISFETSQYLSELAVVQRTNL